MVYLYKNVVGYRLETRRWLRILHKSESTESHVRLTEQINPKSPTFLNNAVK